MRKILSALVLLITLASFGQKNKATLYFKDGKTVTGLAKITGSDKIKFRKTKNSKKIKYTYKELKGVKIYYNDKITEFEFKKIKEKHNIENLFEVMLRGKVNLYKDVRTYYSGTGVGFGVGGNLTVNTGMNYYSIASYYVSTDEENVVSHIRSNTLFNKSFKKVIASYFKDCPSLIAKVERREYKKRHLYEIVEYYNKNCGE